MDTLDSLKRHQSQVSKCSINIVSFVFISFSQLF